MPTKDEKLFAVLIYVLSFPTPLSVHLLFGLLKKIRLLLIIMDVNILIS